MSLTVVKSGVLSVLQDNGRRGHYRLGLTEGGPLDAEAFHYCNRLLGNPPDATVVEISVGGATFEATVPTAICVTGAEADVNINEESVARWQVHPVAPGDKIHIGHARRGCRFYLGVAGGFAVTPQFGSSATVVREGIGGLDGGPLREGDSLPCTAVDRHPLLRLPDNHQPRYSQLLTVRVIPCYQHTLFSRDERRRFFGGPYTVSQRADRMGYQLHGEQVHCARSRFLSEGIARGAIQITGEGQPIVLLNDRATIGGYPKIGTALSLDLSRLSQLTAGATVYFTPITHHTARRALLLAQRFGLVKPLQSVG